MVSKLTVLGRKELRKGSQTSGRALLCLNEWRNAMLSLDNFPSDLV